MARKTLTRDPTTVWGCTLLGHRLKTKGQPKPDGESHWPMDRAQFLAERINAHLADPVSLWTYIRWETGARTPKQPRMDEVLNAITSGEAEPCDA